MVRGERQQRAFWPLGKEKDKWTGCRVPAGISEWPEGSLTADCLVRRDSETGR